MKSLIAAILAVTAGLVAASTLGVAAAEAPTTSPPLRTVTVDGVAHVPLAQGANVALATAAYRQAMADAITDGQSKAEFLASHAGATIGSVQSIAEGGGSISCTGGESSEESNYTEYDGEQPDFGSGSPASPAPLERSAVAPKAAVRKAKKKKSKHASPVAKKAAAVSCTLSTDVSLVETLN